MPKVCLVIILFICSIASCFKYELHNEKLKYGKATYRRNAMFSFEETPSLFKKGDDLPFVNVNATFTRKLSNTDNKNEGNGVIQIIFAESSSLNNIGTVDSSLTKHICCTPLAIEENICPSNLLGKVIINQPDLSLQVLDIQFESNDPVKHISHNFKVTETGEYYLFFSSCFLENGDVLINGEVNWLNNFGYLPGESIYNLYFFKFISIGYIFIGVLWALLCVLYYSELLQIHQFITIAVFFGFLDSECWYLQYNNLNENGVKSFNALFAANLVSSVFGTVFRLLVVVVCMGVGMMKSSIGSDSKNYLYLFGFAYFLTSFSSDVFITYSEMTGEHESLQSFALFPSLAIDCLFLFWVINEMSTNIHQLKKRNQHAKLRIYRAFWYFLLSVMIGTSSFAFYQVFVYSRVTEDSRWRLFWIFGALWKSIQFATIFLIGSLWRPNKNSNAYAMFEQLAGDDEDEDESEFVEMYSKDTYSKS
eukprot:c15339_g1_i1.p1 GENE.c15339_g1_i1~~c15339_g1_i1.p1  ORF type:complete len:478 (+),score=113.02 c15339_g1_i1:31-1464(+)